ncbi:GNAT family N-acetyltransferase [Planomonospora parontospora]|uniref:GNAT family N-acetyltransferase n=1 Tax=Planomonospora parontospora TaxID=58119 RepID=UPI001670F6E8|nr:GNAT family N-acetyltransferase [Planomonospora parontospora]
MPHQHPETLTARLEQTNETSVVYGWPAGSPRCVLAFRQTGRGWRSLFPGAPVLAASDLDPGILERLLGEIAADLGTGLLYFPLAYPESAAADRLAAVPRMAVWRRSPSPVVRWDDGGHGVMERFRERHGSQATRKTRRWNSSLRAATMTGTAACAALAEIERHSWKASARLDLDSEGQLGYYQRLLRRRLVTMSAAVLGDRPVAYRLDARHQDTVYALEWSYDARFGGHAPGMFLMVDGLRRRWGGVPLKRIDLFGGPDMLKLLVATGDRERIDFAWPAGPAADRLRRERHAHDARLRRCLDAGVGVRAAYSAPEPS